MDGEAIIDFAFNSFKSFVYSALYFINLCAKNFVKIWLCAAVEAETFPFSKKTLFGYIAIREVVCWQWTFAPHHTVHTLLLCVNNIKNNKYCNWRDHIRRYMAFLECENVVMQVNALIVHTQYFNS